MIKRISEELNNKVEQELEEGKKYNSPFTVLTLGALGVVFGDIGTSPLYAIKESFMHTGIPVNPENIYRFLSMIFWLLLIVVSTKYVTFVMRANNRGEGGDFALMALVLRLTRPNPRLCYVMGLLGIAAGSLFYADAVITPAISVLSAVEGIQVVAPAFKMFVIPLAVVIIFGLFWVQKHGTGKVGNAFGPVMLVWFSTLGLLGLRQLMLHPEVLQAVNPMYALQFIVAEPTIAFVALSATVLSVTGAEALYADMGHFGVKPIKVAWFFLVWPCLLLNYFGQGALLLHSPAAVENPFYLLAPEGFAVPLLVLATISTIIASQAVISGAFSLTRQAVQLGYLPRMRIEHTSDKEEGQVYIPLVNWLLLLAVLVVVLMFKSSSGLAAAYGLAVTGAMGLASILVAVVMRLKWQWKWRTVILVAGSFMVVDLMLFTSALTKFFSGGYMPAVMGVFLFTLLTTWKRGQAALTNMLARNTLSIERFIKSIEQEPPVRVQGTAIYMNPRHNVVPSALLYNLKHNKVLHEHVVFLTVVPQEVPHVEESRRVQVYELGENFYQVDFYTGFQDVPDVSDILEQCFAKGVEFDHIYQSTFFLGREVVVPVEGGEMAQWREHIFALMKQNAASAVSFYRIPGNRVCELGSRHEI